jgi:hypothetical protein
MFFSTAFTVAGALDPGFPKAIPEVGNAADFTDENIFTFGRRFVFYLLRRFRFFALFFLGFCEYCFLFL